MTSPTKFGAQPPSTFIKSALRAFTGADVESLLTQVPITPEDDYNYDPDNPERGWRPGSLHWVPVGGERGNAGRIKQANQPVNPIAERAINGMEALIEMARQRELLADPSSDAPPSPRHAILRYFDLPPLDQLPKLEPPEEAKVVRARARDMAKRLRVRLSHDKASKKFTVAIEDEGIGQSPESIHRTLLSLGSTTKADKWYLIGVFGQGGSSAYAVSEYSWVVSRRTPDLLNGESGGAGWTVVKRLFPKGRRDDYFAYLAASPDGRVPFVSVADADEAGIPHGTRFVHIGYDFGRGGSAITRVML